MVMQEKASGFDQNCAVKREVELSLGALKQFRERFPFVENLREIEWLDPDKLCKLNPDEVGEFFLFLEGFLKNLGRYAVVSTNIYRNVRFQISDFKNLLRTTVDDRKSLAQKVDAPWERIGGISQDKALPKKIIFCFNYEKGIVLPVFSNQHLRFFVNRVVDYPTGQIKYFSQGQEYEHYTQELIETKNSLLLTKDWSPLYFVRFLYAVYPPPDTETIGGNAVSERRANMTVTDEQLDLQGFMRLLGELQKQGKIEGEQFREYRAHWMSQPSDRDALIARLKRLNAPEK